MEPANIPFSPIADWNYRFYLPVKKEKKQPPKKLGVAFCTDDRLMRQKCQLIKE